MPELKTNYLSYLFSPFSAGKPYTGRVCKSASLGLISTPAQQTFSITKYITKAVLFCDVFTGLFVVFSFAKNFVANNFERLAHGIIGTLPGFLATYLFLKFDKQKFSSIGLTFEPYTIARFFCGVAAGVLLMGLLLTTRIF